MPKQSKSSPQICLHPLDPKFVGPKPLEWDPPRADREFRKLESEGNLIIQRKRDGHCVYVAVTGKRRKRIEIYSRGIGNLTKKFPSLVKELRSMHIPTDTLLAGELVVSVKGVDSNATINSFTKSDDARSLETQKEYEPVRLALFNIIVLGGESVIGAPYGERLEMLQKLSASHEPKQVDVVELLNMSFDDAIALSKKNGWEGLVLYDRLAPSEYRVDGKTDQPLRLKGCWKRKEYLSDDFAVISFNLSTSGSNKGLVEDVNLAQRDRKTGEWVNFGKFGYLTAKEREEWRNPSLYPFVIELGYERTTPNNKLIGKYRIRNRNPEDKKAEECYMRE